MNIKTTKLILELDADDIDTLWNIVAFALDFDDQRHMMTENERHIAQKLVKALQR